MATVRIKGVQMTVGAKKADNLPRIINLIERNGGDCDVIVFPEMALTGNNDNFSDKRTTQAWEEVAALSRAHYLTVIIGTGARHDGHTFNQARIFTEGGDEPGVYEKLVPTETERTTFWPGEDLPVFEASHLNFGCLIGNDFWVAPGFGPYPDRRLSYQLGQKGAQVIFHLNDSGTDTSYTEYYEANLKLRAREARAHVVTVNVAQDGGPVNVPSGVLSPEGDWIERCNTTGETVFTVDIDVD